LEVHLYELRLPIDRTAHHPQNTLYIKFLRVLIRE
jgi:hypothetical protein